MYKSVFFFVLSCISLLAVENVSLQLKWKNSFQFAGFYMAKEKGFYKKAGLNVDIRELKPNQRANVAKEVLNNNVNFGIYDSGLIYRILKGEPIELLIPILEHSPLILASLNPNVKNLKDIRDYNVTISKYAVKNPAIISMFKTQGVDVKDLNAKALKYNYKNFLKHKAVFSLYETDELYFLEKMGIEYKLFKPIDYGFDFYGDILFTSKKELEEHPARVEKFVEATKDGWRYAVSHIDETVKVILSKYNTQHLKYDKLKDEAERLLPYISKSFDFNYKKLENISDIYILLNIVEVKQDIKTSVYEPTVLTDDERNFLNQHIFKCISTATWAPFNTLEGEKLVGIAVDYWDKIKKYVQLKSRCKIVKSWGEVLKQIKEGKADLTIATGITDKRKEYALFSKPYVSFPIAIATRYSVDFISDISYLKDKKIAMAKDYTSEKIIKKHYPDLNIIETKNIQEALQLVKEGKAFAAMDILPVLAYIIGKEYISELKISGKTKYSFDIRIMIRKEYAKLVPVINKAIDMITVDEKRKIYNRWISVKYQNGYSLRQIMIFLIAGAALLFFISLWVFILKREIQKRKELERELEALATKDKLTQIYNRHKIDLSLTEQLEIAKRYHKVFGVIFFDIDYFKDINDTYGHKMGDYVLKELARIVSENIRKSDLLGRWGGEEFLIILPETTKEEAVNLAEKLRNIISKHKFKGVEHLTCSFGVTEYMSGDTTDSIMNRVDKMLYKAKYEGRNRVVKD